MNTPIRNRILQIVLSAVLVMTALGQQTAPQTVWAAADDVPGTGSLGLDGTSDYLTVTHNPPLNNTSAMTWEAWVWRDDATRCETVLGKSYATNYWLGFCDGKLRFYSGGGSPSQDAAVGVPAGGWHHIAVSWQNLGSRKYYIDGNQVYTGTAGLGSSGSAVLGIGADFDGGFKFKGKLAEVRIWNRVRTLDELRLHANQALIGTETGLVGYWPLASDAQDRVTKKVATPHGTPTFGSDAPPWAGSCGGVYEAQADAMLSQASPTSNDGNGFYLNLLGTAGEQKTAVLGFAPVLTPGMTIYRATLELWMDSQVPPPVYTVKAFAYPFAFDEATITWNNSSPPQLPVTSDAFTAPFGFIRLDVTPQVIGWLTADPSKHNLLLQSPGSTLTLGLQSRENNVPPRIIIECAYARAAAPVDQSPKDAAQTAGILRLGQDSSTPLQLRLGEDGTVRTASFAISVPPTVTGNSADRAHWFLNEYRDALRLDDPATQLQLVGAAPDAQHLTFRRRENGIPVFPAELSLHMQGNIVNGFNGRYIDTVGEPPQPRISLAMAETLAMGSVQGETQLVYLNRGLLGMSDPRTRLAWRVTVRGARNETAFIDADSGERLLGLPHELDAFDLEMRSADGQRADNVLCWIFINTFDWFDEFGVRGGASPNAEGNAAFADARAIDGFWRSTYGQDGWNNRGEKQNFILKEGGNFGTPGYFNNAYFSPHCNNLSFGQGNATRDIAGHEWGHAFVNRNGDLVYQLQSGALNESIGDIFGFMVDQDETIGEGSNLGIIRNFRNPPANGDPDHMLAARSGDAQGFRMLPPGVAPDCDANDCGGVHTNSGINNKAAALLVFGGVHDGRSINLIGATKVGQLYRNIMLNRRLNSSAQFMDMRDAALAEARALRAAPGSSWFVSDVCQVQNAYAAVGLGDGDSDCDGTPDASETDSDNDRIPNARDNCPNLSNSGQQNMDGDGFGDACDPDIDGDTIINTNDNCRLVPNPDQANVDGDARGDVCDDGDGDGVMDPVDNCPLVRNADQRDIDRDRIGDVCDADRDGDGRPNVSDNAPNDYNPSQADTDGDGIGNIIDRCPSVASSDNSDVDRDGLAPACDPDDDNDGLLDGADNCPSVYNPDQTDRDENGIGLACDNAELADLIGQFRDAHGHVRTTITTLPIPIPDCWACGVGNFRGNFAVDIVGQPPLNMGMRIVDNSGAAMATTQLGNGLRFFPAPNAVNGLQGIGLARGDASASSTPADGVSYQLQLYMLNGQAPAQPITVPLQMRAGSFASVFLPALSR